MYTTVITNDRLVKVEGLHSDDGAVTKCVRRGKRVGKNCPLTETERRAYCKEGTIAAVREIRSSRGLSLRDAVNLLNSARG